MHTLRARPFAAALSLAFACFPGVADAQRPDAGTGVRVLRRPLTPRLDALLRPRTPALDVVSTWTPAVLTEVATGSGDDELGVRPGQEDEQARVPSALAAFSDGRVLVVDGENERLVTLDAAGRMSATERGLSFTRGIVDLVQVGGERFLAYNPRLQALVDLDAKGREYQHFDARDLGALTGLRRLGGDVLITTPLVQWQFGARRATTGLRPMPRPPVTPGRPRTAGTTPSRVRLPREALTSVRTRAVRTSEARSVSTSVREGRGTVSLFTGASELPLKTVVVTAASGQVASLTYVATDRQGRIFVRLETLEAGEALTVRRFVRVYDRELVELTTFEYPIDGVLVPEKDLDVDDAGNVFVLLPYADRVQVVRYAAPRGR